MSKLKGLLGKGKGFMGSLVTEGTPIVLTTAGVIAGQKFLDFKTLFPNVKPDEFFIKHEGLIKLGGVVVTLALWKNCPVWLKWILIGVAIQGGIKAVRQYTMSDAGKAFVEQIGEGDYDTAIMDAARSIHSITNEFKTGVADVEMGAKKFGTDMNKERNPAVDLVQYSNTGVSGMGMEDYDILRNAS